MTFDPHSRNNMNTRNRSAIVDLIESELNGVAPLINVEPPHATANLERNKLCISYRNEKTAREAKILMIVDANTFDEHVICDSIFDEKYQYQLYQVDNCIGATDIIKSNELDLIIADWDMLATSESSDRLSTETLLSAHNVPLLLLTNNTAFYNKINAPQFDEAIVDCVRKPLDMIELNARVRLLLSLTDQLRQSKLEGESIRRELNLRHRELHLELIIHSESIKEKFLEGVRGLDAFLNNEGKTKLKHIVRQFKWTINNETNINFERAFDELNSPLYQQLEKICPEITRSEKRLCVFTLRNHSGTEIAKTTGKSQNSINVAFARLRAKLGLANNKELKKLLLHLNNLVEKEIA